MNVKARSCSVGVVAVLVAFAAGGRASAQETVPPPASTQPPPVGGSVGYFGEHGQIVVSGDLRFNIQRESHGSETATTYEVQPALDYFVSSNVSVGGLVGVRRDNLGAPVFQTTIGLGARVGYNLVLAGPVSWWIRVGLTYEHQNRTGTGGPDLSGYAIPFSVYAPVLWHPASHFFIGVGPFFSVDLIARVEGIATDRTLDVGLSSTVGGYFGGL